MKVLHDLSAMTLNDIDYALTIGFFDGVHNGHKAVLNRIKQLAKKYHTSAAAITFSNHPSTILKPTLFIPQICTVEHKIKLLEEDGINLLFVLEFTQALSEKTPREFLQEVRQSILFKSLVFGNDGRIGRDRQGDHTTIKALAKEMGFSVEYFPDLEIDHVRVSSSLIREYIKRGEFDQASKLLGRPYSIYSKVIKGHGRGAAIGFPTLNIGLDNLCLPPLGVYKVSVRHGENYYQAIANLGVAPTVREKASPVLEVHLLGKDIDLYGKSVEVIFGEYLRPEKKFATIDDLKAQIMIDIRRATN